MLENLDRPIPDIIANLTASDLATIQAQLANAVALLKRRKDVFDTLMLRKFGLDAQAAYSTAKKDTGTVHMPATNTMNLKVEVDKTVTWDQPKLYSIFQAMKPEDAQHYAKVEYKVAEAKYANAPPDVQKKLTAARTVSPGKMKFTFEYVVLDEQQEAV